MRWPLCVRFSWNSDTFYFSFVYLIHLPLQWIFFCSKINVCIIQIGAHTQMYPTFSSQFFLIFKIKMCREIKATVFSMLTPNWINCSYDTIVFFLPWSVVFLVKWISIGWKPKNDWKATNYIKITQLMTFMAKNNCEKKQHGKKVNKQTHRNRKRKRNTVVQPVEEVEVIWIKWFRYESYHMNLSAKYWNREVAQDIPIPDVCAADRVFLFRSAFEFTHLKLFITHF